MSPLQAMQISLDGIVFKPSDEQVRADCLAPFAGHELGCPNYGTTYGCPPYAPSIDEFKVILAEYRFYYLVYGEIVLGSDTVDPVEEKAKYAAMQLEVDSFIMFLQDTLENVFIIHGYGCHYCERVGEGSCACPDEPCRHPEKRTYSISVAFDIVATMNTAGIPMELNPADGSHVYRRISIVASKERLQFDRLFQEFEEYRD
jgi:predicted metal-binding protein